MNLEERAAIEKYIEFTMKILENAQEGNTDPVGLMKIKDTLRLTLVMMEASTFFEQMFNVYGDPGGGSGDQQNP